MLKVMMVLFVITLYRGYNEEKEVIGSVSKQTARRVKCPVMIIK